MADGRESPLFHPPTVLRQLNAFRHHNLYCDVTISVAGTKFRCHRAVLAANSVFFHHLLLPGNRGRLLLPGDRCYHLDHMGAPTFSALLQYMYTSQLFLSDPRTARDLLHGARSLGLLSLVDLVADYLLDTDSGDGDDRTEPSGAEEEGGDVPEGNDSGEVDRVPTENRPAVKEEAAVKLELQEPADPGCTDNLTSLDSVPQQPAELVYPHHSAHKLPLKPADPGCQQSSVNSVDIAQRPADPGYIQSSSYSVEVPQQPADPGYRCNSAPDGAGAVSAHPEETQVLDKVMTLLRNLSQLVSTNGRQELEVVTADSSGHIRHGHSGHIRHGTNDHIRHDHSRHTSQEELRSGNSADPLELRSGNSADFVEQRSGNYVDLEEQRSGISADLIEQRSGNSADPLELRSGNSADLLQQRSGNSADLVEQMSGNYVDPLEQRLSNSNDLLGQSSEVCKDLEENHVTHQESEKHTQDRCAQNVSGEERMEGKRKWREEEMGREDKRTARACSHNRKMCSTKTEWVQHASCPVVKHHSKTGQSERGWTADQCLYCRQLCSSRKQLQEHRFRHKGQNRKNMRKTLRLKVPKQCPDCKRACYRWRDWTRHRCMHKNRVCQTCGELTNQACLGRHLLSRSASRQHTCETRGKRFSCKRHLQLPSYSVRAGSDPLKCTQCGRTFISSVD